MTYTFKLIYGLKAGDGTLYCFLWNVILNSSCPSQRWNFPVLASKNKNKQKKGIFVKGKPDYLAGNWHVSQLISQQTHNKGWSKPTGCRTSPNKTSIICMLRSAFLLHVNISLSVTPCQVAFWFERWTEWQTVKNKKNCCGMWAAWKHADLQVSVAPLTCVPAVQSDSSCWGPSACRMTCRHPGTGSQNRPVWREETLPSQPSCRPPSSRREEDTLLSTGNISDGHLRPETCRDRCNDSCSCIFCHRMCRGSR